jgi:hypothetical protein
MALSALNPSRPAPPLSLDRIRIFQVRFELFGFLAPAKCSPKTNTQKYAKQHRRTIEEPCATKGEASGTKESEMKPAIQLHNRDDSYNQSQDEWQDDAPK